MGGCEEGEGKGTKMYGVVGITDGPGCVSTLMLVDVVVAGAENGVLEEVSDDEDEGEVKAEVITQLVPSFGFTKSLYQFGNTLPFFSGGKGRFIFGHWPQPNSSSNCCHVSNPNLITGLGLDLRMRRRSVLYDQSFCGSRLSINKHHDVRIAQAHDVTYTMKVRISASTHAAHRASVLFIVFLMADPRRASNLSATLSATWSPPPSARNPTPPPLARISCTARHPDPVFLVHCSSDSCQRVNLRAAPRARS